MRHTISVLVENKFGVLARVSGMFSGRGFNIHSLNVAPTHDRSLSRITVVAIGDDQVLDQIIKQLNKLVNANCKLVLSFEAVDFLSSAALSKLISLEKLVKSHRGQLRFCNVSPNVYELFAITRLDKLFDIKGDEHEAIASLS